MSEPKKFSPEWFEERDKAWKREAREFTESLPPRVNGPSYILMCQGDPGSGVNSLLMQPVTGDYDEMIVLAEWRMADPNATALLEVLWTADEFPGVASLWSNLLPHSDTEGSWVAERMDHPTNRNSAKLRFLGVGHLTVAFRLNTYPADAKLDAKIRVLLLGGGKEKAT